MDRLKKFLERKNIEISVKRYLVDALGAMAQGLFCSLLIGTIINTAGQQFGWGFLNTPVAMVGGVGYTVGGLATAMSGPAMAAAIGYALKCPPLRLSENPHYFGIFGTCFHRFRLRHFAL